MSLFSNVIRFLFITMILVVALTLAACISLQVMDENRPLNEVLTQKAWDAYKNGHYVEAMTSAESCIETFSDSANQIQEDLENRRMAIPKGAVSEAQKTMIHQNGLLNDVATCTYIKGLSAKRLGKVNEARQAFQLTIKYTHARTWDTQGWFWSPADAAAGENIGLN